MAELRKKYLPDASDLFKKILNNLTNLKPQISSSSSSSSEQQQTETKKEVISELKQGNEIPVDQLPSFLNKLDFEQAKAIRQYAEDILKNDKSSADEIFSAKEILKHIDMENIDKLSVSELQELIASDSATEINKNMA